MPSFLSRRDGQALVTRNGGRLLEEIIEIESGKRNDRPELRRAICRGKVSGARVIIAQARQIEQKCGGRLYSSHTLASALSVVLQEMFRNIGTNRSNKVRVSIRGGRGIASLGNATRLVSAPGAVVAPDRPLAAR
jgi:hypothetical protein